MNPSSADNKRASGGLYLTDADRLAKRQDLAADKPFFSPNQMRDMLRRSGVDEQMYHQKLKYYDRMQGMIQRDLNNIKKVRTHCLDDISKIRDHSGTDITNGEQADKGTTRRGRATTATALRMNPFSLDGRSGGTNATTAENGQTETTPNPKTSSPWLRIAQSQGDLTTASKEDDGDSDPSKPQQKVNPWKKIQAKILERAQSQPALNKGFETVVATLKKVEKMKEETKKMRKLRNAKEKHGVRDRPAIFRKMEIFTKTNLELREEKAIKGKLKSIMSIWS